MKNKDYPPEGRQTAGGDILQARCIMCDRDHNLQIEYGGHSAIIPRDQAAIGIKEGTVGDVAIITRVNKMVCFKKVGGILSRAAAQREYLEWLKKNVVPGDVLDARITHLEKFGAFCDIGCGIISMIPIDAISVSRIDHPSVRFKIGQDVRVIVSAIEGDRINVTHKELLGTWQQNADRFLAGQTVSGIVRSIEQYGVFVELTPNLAGLAEPTEGICVGEQVSVYIKSILPEKMKVKLAIIESTGQYNDFCDIKYFFVGCHLGHWKYSPDGCKKLVETVF